VAELSVLHELSRAVTGRLDREDLVATIQQQVARVLNVNYLVLLLHDEAADELEVVLRVVDGAVDAGGPRRYPRHGVGLMSVVLDTGRSIRTSDYLAECARRGVDVVARAAEVRHWLGVPMRAGDRSLGVLVLRSAQREFTAADEHLLANIGDLAALALRSSRLFEERTRAYGELAAAQDQLVRTEKLRALGEMASGVAHDFNNVLAAIVGRAQLLLKEVRDPKHRRWLEVIERSGLDGAQTVRRLQEFTRIRRDQPVVAVSLNQVVEETLESTESSWRDEPRSRGVTVDVRMALAPDLPPVGGDPAELREALINLILNALDAMPQGGTLTLSTAAAGGDRVELLVTDTGIGMPEHVRQRIFDPFFTTKGPSGTGLGLSMTYGILSRHGAKITVESEEGRGTRFRLSFPSTALAEAAGPRASAPAASVPLRCLVVDDEAPVGEVLGDIIESAGHGAVVVGSGAAALERFRGEPFDAVFTDLAMPGLSGWEVAKAVTALRPDVPVFLVTGFGIELSPQELAASGVRTVLTKPLDMQETLALLARLRRAE
jgi:signal transduction histidine kinase